MTFEYLSDMVAYYKPLITTQEIDDIIADIEKDRPNLYKINPKEYLRRVEMDINIYIGNKETRRR